jgi:predicted nucleic acid-binding protein
MIKVYLDNCCFNRPFDDQTHLRIKIESEAKLKIQAEIHAGRLSLIWSYILDAENTANPFEERKTAIENWKNNAIIDINENSEIIDSAIALTKIGLRSKDALHIACAISANCNYFITTDDAILNKNSMIDNLTIIDPFGFIKEVY